MSIDLNTRPATSITINPPAQAEAKPYVYTTGKKVAATEAEFLGHEGGFGFSDFLDIINPLQHIPIISTAYRAITGDTISPGARMLGGGLLGGITGLVASAAEEIFKGETGSDIGETVVAALTGKPANADLAQAQPAAPTSSATQTAPLALANESPLATLDQVNTKYRQAQILSNVQSASLKPIEVDKNKESERDQSDNGLYEDWLSSVTRG